VSAAVAPRRSTLVGLVGQGVGPSLTPEIHEREALRQGLRYVYKVLELGPGSVAEDRLRALLDSAVRMGFDGLNVTHPVKQAIVPLVDRVTSDVAAIGALNTVLMTPEGTVGHNTDVTGFAESLTEGLPDAPRESVVLLGAGGAGTAVAHALAGLGVQRLHVADHDRDRVSRLIDSVHAAHPATRVGALPTEEVGDVLAAASGLVNATPVGMAAHPGLPLDEGMLHPKLWVADIVYRPVVTGLLRAAADRGCRTLAGSGMAVHQAADAFELITGRTADRAAMARDLTELVAAEMAERATHEDT
jgi:shikimate dehydrogenase